MDKNSVVIGEVIDENGSLKLLTSNPQDKEEFCWVFRFYGPCACDACMHDGTDECPEIFLVEGE